MTKKNWNLNDNRIYVLIFSLFVILCGIWYTNYKNKTDFVFSDNTIINEKSVNNSYETQKKDLDIIEKSEIQKNQGENTLPYDTIVNINKANAETLEMLPSIGKTLANNIINYRQENGNFKTIEEIKNVPKIGDKIFEKIKNRITVE